VTPATCSRDGEFADLLAELIDRFPVSGLGERNRQMSRSVASLVGRGYRAELIEDVVESWWRHWYRVGMIGTPPNHARKLIRANIERTLENPKFGRAVNIDHLELCRDFSPNASQKRQLEEYVITSQGLEIPPPTCNRVTSGPQLCRTQQETAFVLSLVTYFSYKVFVLRENPLRATRDQISQIIKEHHGISLKNPQFERLKRKYIPRDGKPATRFELAVQTRTGRQGIPSEFELTGLLRLMNPQESPVNEQIKDLFPLAG
jgi:hypothetical protein